MSENKKEKLMASFETLNNIGNEILILERGTVMDDVDHGRNKGLREAYEVIVRHRTKILNKIKETP